MNKTSTYSDLSVLYLEDEVLIAMDCEAMLGDIGIDTIHCAASLSEAQTVASSEEINFAILDINVGNNETSFGLASELSDKGIPVMFVTGYNVNELPDGLESAIVVEKPLDATTLRKTISQSLSRGQA